MWGARSPYKGLMRLLIFAVSITPTLSLSMVETVAPASAHGSYHYQFFVDEDGFTNVIVDYESAQNGSSWVIVPKFTNWRIDVSSGHIQQSEIVETQEVVEEKHYFYQAFVFSFTSDDTFRLSVQFNSSVGALIIEPRGIFFSPQIGFQDEDDGKAEVFLPDSFKIDTNRAFAIGRSSNYQPSNVSSNYALFDLPQGENLIRLQIEIETSAVPIYLTLTQKIFTFNTTERYEGYASDILDLYDRVYDDLVELFNVTLESVNVGFFLPDFSTLFNIGGYVPFTATEMGDIHINLFFVRFVKGVLEVIALHELVHHFLWRTGLHPSSLLWFHEGMAQYISIEVVDGLGYEGAPMERDRLERSASQLIERTDGNLHFLQLWRPEQTVSNMAAYYAASYYIVSRLAKEHGEFAYYTGFFKTIRGAKVEDNDVLTYHLSLAANSSVALSLKKWGFDVVDLYAPSDLAEETRRVIYKLSFIFQPYRFIAEYLYNQALISLENGDEARANRYLRAAFFMAKSAPLLTLLTIAALTIIIIYANERRRAHPMLGGLPPHSASKPIR